MEEKEILNSEKLNQKIKKIKKKCFWCVIFPVILSVIFALVELILFIIKEESYKIDGNLKYDYYTNINTETIIIIAILESICLLYLVIGLIYFIKSSKPFFKSLKETLIKEEITNKKN